MAHAARSRWFERQPQQGRRIRKLARCSSCGPLPRDGRRLSYGWRGKGRRDGLLFGANASDDDFMPPSGWARARARAERSLWTVSLTRRRASALLQVRQSRGRGGPSSFRTKLRLYIGSKMATMITKATKPIRVRTQYPRLRLFFLMVPRNAGGRRRRRRRDCCRIATIAGATRAGPKCAVQ